jgi:hypothetical protein
MYNKINSNTEWALLNLKLKLNPEMNIEDLFLLVEVKISFLQEYKDPGHLNLEKANIIKVFIILNLTIEMSLNMKGEILLFKNQETLKNLLQMFHKIIYLKIKEINNN